ncbi:hypothetical protein KP509_29G040400 [Ceratopteris richardii]|uniref:Uncharacterized protein n=1 Tax=Ceratopteris richardii TaxID=49495 RepID=A0A8T2R8I9_CERRI|nr:hypothetical protein KP509_29G040400 [Ceratopteris richardii]
MALKAKPDASVFKLWDFLYQLHSFLVLFSFPMWKYKFKILCNLVREGTTFYHVRLFSVNIVSRSRIRVYMLCVIKRLRMLIVCGSVGFVPRSSYLLLKPWWYAI